MNKGHRTKRNVLPTANPPNYAMPKTRAARRAEAEKARASKDDAFEDKGEDASGASSAEGGVEPKAASGAAIIDTAAIKAAIKENEPTDTGGSVASSTAQVDEDDSSKCKGKVEKSAGDAIQAPGDKDDDSADDDDVDINFVCGPTAHKRALELITEGLCVFCEKKAIVGKAWSSTFKICRHAKCLAKNCFGSKEIDLYVSWACWEIERLNETHAHTKHDPRPAIPTGRLSNSRTYRRLGKRTTRARHFGTATTCRVGLSNSR